MNYRFARRSFLRSIGAAAGLHTLLRNVEASAQGTVRPARLIVAHRPLGTTRWAFIPTSGTTGGSRLLQPFGDLGLSSDMIVFSGVNTSHLNLSGGGGHEQGTVVLVTGVNPGGARANLREGDDAFAAGPSFDQLFLERSAALRVGGANYVNVACDARTDFGEISTKCLSYSTVRGSVRTYSGGTATQNLPLMPYLSPLAAYTSLFANFVPQGPTPQNLEAVAKARAQNQSVLDLMLSDLRRLESLGPSSEKSKIEAHLEAIRDVERTLDASVQASCGTTPPAPPATPVGKADPTNGVGNFYGNAKSGTDDMASVAAVAASHWAVIKAAFICDLVRVATFQFEPGTGHVGFKGLFPGDLNSTYRRHPISHEIAGFLMDQATPPPPHSSPPVLEFLMNVEQWYNLRFAELLADFKATTDPFGNNLLGTTVIPYVTEVRSTGHARNQMPAIIFGGRDLGMLGGQYRTENVTINSLWGTIAQPFIKEPAAPPLAAPMSGLWKSQA